MLVLEALRLEPDQLPVSVVLVVVPVMDGEVQILDVACFVAEDIHVGVDVITDGVEVVGGEDAIGEDHLCISFR